MSVLNIIIVWLKRILNYEYLGEPEITEEDIEEWKFKNNVNKYNL